MRVGERGVALLLGTGCTARRAIVEVAGPTIVLVTGIHGDEPAGSLVTDIPTDIQVVGPVNNTGKRRKNGVDLNRHFDGSNSESDRVLSQVLKASPALVITTHEDDEVDSVYAYASPDMAETAKQVLRVVTGDIAAKAHADVTDDGVITGGRQPYAGSLERACEQRGIPYVCVETPKSMPIKERVRIQTAIINGLRQRLVDKR